MSMHSQNPEKYSRAESSHTGVIFMIVYLLTYDSGKVSLEHVLLSWYPPRDP